DGQRVQHGRAGAVVPAGGAVRQEGAQRADPVPEMDLERDRHALPAGRELGRGEGVDHAVEGQRREGRGDDVAVPVPDQAVDVGVGVASGEQADRGDPEGDPPGGGVGCLHAAMRSLPSRSTIMISCATLAWSWSITLMSCVCSLSFKTWQACWTVSDSNWLSATVL